MVTKLQTALMPQSFACSTNLVRANMVPWCLAQGQYLRPCFQLFPRLSRLYYRLSPWPRSLWSLQWWHFGCSNWMMTDGAVKE